MKLNEEINQLLELSVRDQVIKAMKDKNLQFEKRTKTSSVSSIAFSEKHKSWVGFSHRAMQSFGKGDMLFDAKYTGDLEEKELEKLPFKKRGSVVIATMEQAKQAAMNFAEYVS